MPKVRRKLVLKQREFRDRVVGNVTSGPVTDLLLLSTPSIVKLLFRGRCPPIGGPSADPKPPAGSDTSTKQRKVQNPTPGRMCGIGNLLRASAQTSIYLCGRRI